jgi:hypothetical protein
MTDALNRLQAEIERVLDHHFPERVYAFFDRPQLISSLMTAAHMYASEFSKGVVDKLVHLQSQPIVIIPGKCPNCSGRGVAPVHDMRGECGYCRGAGVVNDICGLHGPCAHCDGTGLEKGDLDG